MASILFWSYWIPGFFHHPDSLQKVSTIHRFKVVWSVLFHTSTFHAFNTMISFYPVLCGYALLLWIPLYYSWALMVLACIAFSALLPPGSLPDSLSLIHLISAVTMPVKTSFYVNRMLSTAMFSSEPAWDSKGGLLTTLISYQMSQMHITCLISTCWMNKISYVPPPRYQAPGLHFFITCSYQLISIVNL